MQVSELSEDLSIMWVTGKGGNGLILVFQVTQVSSTDFRYKMASNPSDLAGSLQRPV